MSWEAADRPGVIVVPPLLYLAALVLGMLMNWAFPWPLPGGIVVRLIGVVVVALGIWVAWVARGEFDRAGTNVNPIHPATTIVTSGPFRWSRNPMYVAMAVAWIGLALATRTGWFLFLLPLLLAVMHWGVILREERYLERKFGALYTEYKQRVRRYI